MNDGDARTYVDFALPESAAGYLQVYLSSPSAITSSFLTVLLDNNVALPSTIETYILLPS